MLELAHDGVYEGLNYASVGTEAPIGDRKHFFYFNFVRKLRETNSKPKAYQNQTKLNSTNFGTCSIKE